MYVQKMKDAGQALLAALETNDTHAIQESAKMFAQAVDEAWQAYLRGEVTTHTRGKALPRTMHQFATVELPAKIADPQAWPTIARETRIFLNMLRVVAS